MEYPKKEIIKEITDLFEDYEETYVPGEWEAFSARKKKKYPFYVPWLSAAAAVLVVLSVVFFNLKSGKKKEHVQFSTVKPAVPKTTPVPVVVHKPEARGVPAARQYVSRSAVKGNNRQSGQRAGLLAVQHVPDPIAVKQSGGELKKDIPAELKKQTNGELVLAGQQGSTGAGKDRRTSDTAFTGQKSMVIAKVEVQPVVTNIPVPQTEVKPKKGKLSMMDFLALESKAADKAVKKKDNRSKWNFGIQVMPAVTGSNVDFGGGVTTAYRISEKFSLSSGVSLLQMQAGKDVPPAPVQASYALSSISSSPEKKLTAVGTNIRALDIPVAVIYKVNQHFYTSAGVSLFNVLNEKRSNTYFQTAQVDNMAVNPATGFVSTYKSLQTTEVMESVVPGTSATGDDPVKQNNSIGFFNFSIGRQQNIFNKYSIQIEPFIKVPLGKFSSENLNLLNSGIKFQLSF
jgi:hypothetical protein